MPKSTQVGRQQGSRQAIPLDVCQFYTSPDGAGGTGNALAEAIYHDLDKHLGLKDGHLLQMQGKVLDGQSLNEPFMTGMNKPS